MPGELIKPEPDIEGVDWLVLPEPLPLVPVPERVKKGKKNTEPKSNPTKLDFIPPLLETNRAKEK